MLIYVGSYFYMDPICYVDCDVQINNRTIVVHACLTRLTLHQSILASAKAAVKAKVNIDVVLTVKEDDPLPDTWYVRKRDYGTLE